MVNQEENVLSPDEQYRKDIITFVKLLCDQKKLLTFNFTYTLGVDDSNVNEILEFVSKVPDSLKEMFQIDILEENCHKRKKDDVDIHTGQWCMANMETLFNYVSKCQQEMNDTIIAMLETIAVEHR